MEEKIIPNDEKEENILKKIKKYNTVSSKPILLGACKTGDWHRVQDNIGFNNLFHMDRILKALQRIPLKVREKV